VHQAESDPNDEEFSAPNLGRRSVRSVIRTKKAANNNPVRPHGAVDVRGCCHGWNSKFAREVLARELEDESFDGRHGELRLAEGEGLAEMAEPSPDAGPRVVTEFGRGV